MSNKLNCTADTCVNNINNLCSANTIHVEGNIASTSSETQCETFSEKGFKNAARFSWKNSAEKTLLVYEELSNNITAKNNLSH